MEDTKQEGTELENLDLEDLEEMLGVTFGEAEGIETIMLAAPTAPDDRLPRVAARCRGFVYSVGLLGVTINSALV